MLQVQEIRHRGNLFEARSRAQLQPEIKAKGEQKGLEKVFGDKGAPFKLVACFSAETTTAKGITRERNTVSAVCDKGPTPKNYSKLLNTLGPCFLLFSEKRVSPETRLGSAFPQAKDDHL